MKSTFGDIKGIERVEWQVGSAQHSLDTAVISVRSISTLYYGSGIPNEY